MAALENLRYSLAATNYVSGKGAIALSDYSLSQRSERAHADNDIADTAFGRPLRSSREGNIWRINSSMSLHYNLLFVYWVTRKQRLLEIRESHSYSHV